MTMIYPEADTVQGNTKVVLGLTCADMTAPKLSEITAASSLDVSLFVRDFNPEVTANSGSAPGRLGTRAQLPSQGNVQIGALDLQYIYKAQQALTTDSNKMRNFMLEGTVFFAFVRKGLAVETAFAATTQRVEVWKYRAGYQGRGKSGDDEFAEYQIAQTAYPVVIPVYDVAVATG